MKKFCKTIHVFTVTIFLSSMSLAQITYVDQNAIGTGDGSSWANAYTDLSLALMETFTGEVWIAGGTYTPSSIELDTFNTFGVQAGVALYGGFAGNESSKEERVDGENTTTLSGDINGDDLPNNLNVNKQDNVFHVMICASAPPDKIILDRLTFQGGNTREASAGDDLNWRGGAVYALGPLEINNCHFNNNFARSGGAVYISNGAESTINNCIFENNACLTQGAGIFISGSSNSTVSNTTFQSNATNRGALYPIDCENFMVDNCTFQNNVTVTDEDFGGAMFIWQSTGVVQNSTFQNNLAGNGAGIFMNGSELGITDTETFTFDNCIFSGNSSSDFGGGALYVWNTTTKVEGCDFQNNSGGSGGAVYMDGREMAPEVGNYVFDNCTFSGNSATTSVGGGIRTFAASTTVQNCNFMSNNAEVGAGILSNGDNQNHLQFGNEFSGNIAEFGASQACYGDFSKFDLNNNVYSGNTVNTSGAGLIIGFGADATVNECEFTGNTAGFGAAIFCQNDTTTVEILNSIFRENTVGTGSGGALNIGGPVTVTVDRCLFEMNTGGFGGAISGSEGEVDLIEGYLHLSNSRILLNNAENQGAAISLVDLDLEMTNTVIATNFLLGTGAGGGLSLNTTANRSSTFNIVNSTIADNSALIGSGIAAFTEDATSNCTVNLQNTILNNLGSNYEVESGTPVINSLGGNISSDNTLEDIFTNTGDRNEVADLKFVNSANYDFNLEDDSPAVNIGVAEGAPDTDILGNPRVGPPDAGAYENQDPLSTDPMEIKSELSLWPNPASMSTTLELSNEWSGDIILSILDGNGKLMRKSIVQKSSREWSHKMDVRDLNSGLHIILLENKEGKKNTAPFIKI
ncbi:MAG: right-handed parallel beta-helix repeat-containing protein [Bacteroidota bacterium]